MRTYLFGSRPNVCKYIYICVYGYGTTTMRLCLFDDMHRVSSVVACSCHSSTSRAFVLLLLLLMHSHSHTHGGVQYARPHDRLACTHARGQFINTFVLRMRTYGRAPAIRARTQSLTVNLSHRLRWRAKRTCESWRRLCTQRSDRRIVDRHMSGVLRAFRLRIDFADEEVVVFGSERIFMYSSFW